MTTKIPTPLELADLFMERYEQVAYKVRRIWHILKDIDDAVEQPAPNPRRSESRKLRTGEFDDILFADDDDDPLWEQIDLYLRNGGDLWIRSPHRVRMLRSEIRWMRRMAFEDGLEWGKQ